MPVEIADQRAVDIGGLLGQSLLIGLYRASLEKETFRYTGEGQVGDMTFVRANRALRDHLADRKDVHLFESVRTPKPTGYVRYIGQMVVTGWSYEQQEDGQGGRARRSSSS